MIPPTSLHNQKYQAIDLSPLLRKNMVQRRSDHNKFFLLKSLIFSLDAFQIYIVPHGFSHPIICIVIRTMFTQTTFVPIKL